MLNHLIFVTPSARQFLFHATFSFNVNFLATKQLALISCLPSFVTTD